MTSFENFLYEIKNVKVLDTSITSDKYIAIDLSSSKTEPSKKFLGNSKNFEIFIIDYLTKNNAAVAYGGYNEKRSLYHRSDLFTNNSEERDIHIGLDLWADAGTAVLAALEGVVHSFNFNAGIGNYGPTIILEHHINDNNFFTLYGHLNIDSIENIEIGKIIKRNQQIGTIGDSSVNGDYAPHLHFQVIKYLEGKTGDYPGVSSKSSLNHYLKNCPDPDLLLKLEKV